MSKWLFIGLYVKKNNKFNIFKDFKLCNCSISKNQNVTIIKFQNSKKKHIYIQHTQKTNDSKKHAKTNYRMFTISKLKKENKKSRFQHSKIETLHHLKIRNYNISNILNDIFFFPIYPP